jgi:ribosomal peptide maturation radical SAM protein 1
MDTSGAPIVLVNMPFVSLPRPALGLGLLKAVLAQHGLEARVEYANLRYAHRVGIIPYAVVNSYPAPRLLGEWVFSPTVFPDYAPDHETFLASLDPVKGGLLTTREQLTEAAWSLRRESSLFIDELALQIVDSGARVVGCTSTFMQNLASLGLLRRIRELSSEVVTVMGGANCEGVMGEALLSKFPWLDFVVSGEADELAPPFFSDLLQHGRGLRRVPHGVLSRSAPRLSGSVPRATVSSLDQSPTPDFDDFFETLDRLGLRSVVETSLAVETSRGCWWGQKHHCTFCGLNGHGMGFRSKSPERALEQFHTLSERYDCRQFMMTDNILDMSYLKMVLPALAEDSRRYDIFYETKANLKRSHLEMCARAGVRWIQPGLEALSDPLLELMDKGTTALTNLQLLKWARELGIHVTWLALFAFPGDKVEWYEEMLEWVPRLLHLQPPQGVIQVGFHRFSPYFEQAEKYGIRPVPEPGYGYAYPFPEEELSRLAYFFTDPNQAPQAERLVELLSGPLLDWKRRFWEKRPILSLSDDGEQARILDTRAGGFPRRSSHRGLAREVLLRCDAVTSRDRLARDLGVSIEQLKAPIRELEESGLLLCHRHQLLSLPVQGELPTLPSRIPLGNVNYAAWPAPRVLAQMER